MIYKNDLSYEFISSILQYDPETGILRWKEQRGGVKKGDIAGCFDGYHGYIRLRIRKKMYMSHRLCWLLLTGKWPKQQIDHINGDRIDNRACNLRECTLSQNQRNKLKMKNNTSGYTGVYKTTTNKWTATINLGTFKSKEEAALAWNRVTLMLHGEFAKLNEIG